MNETAILTRDERRSKWRADSGYLSKKEISRLRWLLHRKFPNTFVGNKADKIPLAIGISEMLVARLAEIDPASTPANIRFFIKDYCEGARYLRNMVEGANRVDLDGKITGQVTATQALAAARHHKKRLEFLRKTFKTEPAPKEEVAA